MQPRPCLAAAAAISIVVALTVAAHAAARPPDESRMLARQRALASYATMQHYFYETRTSSYYGTLPRAGHAQAWPYSQALWATLLLARVRDVTRSIPAALPARIAGLSAYYGEASGAIAYHALYRNRRYVFSDDNAWISLALLEAADVTQDASLVRTASRVFRTIASDWDDDTSHPCAGGVYWMHAPRRFQRSAVSTANSALLATLLYIHTRERRYLSWALRAYEWSRHCLGRPGGLVADHIDSDGTVDERTWSYNQGAMIATGVNLYRATGKRHFLRAAQQTASTALAVLRDPLGSGEPAPFLAIFYRDLLALAKVDRDASSRAAAQSFADSAWSHARDAQTGLFRFGTTAATLLDQAAMVQIYALLARE